MSDPTPSRRLGDLTVAAFLTALAADTPAPGGGTAAAFAGAMAAALTAMVAGLTVGRERYADVQQEMAAVLAEAEAFRRDLTTGADADANAYLGVLAAYRLPKATDAQKRDRTAAIQAAMRQAAEVPLAVAAACGKVLDLARRVARHGNPNAASDAAVAALMAHAGLQGAARNVRINLASLHDQEFCQDAEAQVAELLRDAEVGLRTALAAADARE